MGMNQTPASERVHISFFGRRNAGKSSVINAVTGQELAIVSDVRELLLILYTKPWSFCPLDLLWSLTRQALMTKANWELSVSKKLSGIE